MTPIRMIKQLIFATNSDVTITLLSMSAVANISWMIIVMDFERCLPGKCPCWTEQCTLVSGWTSAGETLVWMCIKSHNTRKLKRLSECLRYSPVPTISYITSENQQINCCRFQSLVLQICDNHSQTDKKTLRSYKLENKIGDIA